MSMKSTKKSDEAPSSIRPSHHGGEVAVIRSGAVAGAATGAIAGPPGMIVGGALGGVAATLATAIVEVEEHARAEHDAKLDEAIGVIDGDLGAASPNAPPARIGAFSSGSSGAGGGHKQPAEGTMPTGESEE
jgi:hypothetical protein